MAHLIGIAGPSCTGKTRLVDKLREELMNSDINKNNYYIVGDIKDKVWKDLVDTTSVSQWEEIYYDKELLLMFSYRIVEAYESIITEMKGSTFDFCIIDGTYIDLLIYLQLQFWFHYPSNDLLAGILSRTLMLKDKIDKIYMTVADDSAFDYEAKDLRQKMSDFRRNRSIELLYYDIYRDLPVVETISSPVDLNVSDIVEYLKGLKIDE